MSNLKIKCIKACKNTYIHSYKHGYMMSKQITLLLFLCLFAPSSFLSQHEQQLQLIKICWFFYSRSLFFLLFELFNVSIVMNTKDKKKLNC